MRISIDEPEIKKEELTEDAVERESVKKTFKGEMKKLSRMSFKEKLRYIWSYYWIPIVGTLVFVVLVAYIISFVSTRKTTVLMGVVVNDTQTNVEEVSHSIEEYLGVGEKEKVDLLDGVYTNSTSYGTQYSHNMSGSTQLLSYLMAKELDFVICDDTGLEYLLTNVLCREVTDYCDADSEEIKERLVESEDEYGKLYAAISLKDTQFLKELKLHKEDYYLVIVDVAGHKDKIESFIKYIFERE